MATLLVVYHAPTRSLRALVDAALAGAADPAIDGVQVRPLDALAFARGEADHRDLLAADGFLLMTPANFGYMSGALKHVFDATFLQIGGELDRSGAAGPAGGGSTRGRPYGLLVHGRYETGGAVRSVLSLVGALGWRAVSRPVELLGAADEEALDQARELGATLAALLEA